MSRDIAGSRWWRFDFHVHTPSSFDYGKSAAQAELRHRTPCDRLPSESSGWALIKSGSPGQKSAALSAFLLSCGDEPVILDQPEDDLHNQLICDLIVKQIRESKRRRQIIVATHNANVVVNGDAERVVLMAFRNGQSIVTDHGTGCIQESRVREGICRVLEGGSQAFQERYKRLGRE